VLIGRENEAAASKLLVEEHSATSPSEYMRMMAGGSGGTPHRIILINDFPYRTRAMMMVGMIASVLRW
ncbi:MAG: hypothetical protein SGPRY_011659, partial [Prymnesium sp.]